MSLIDQALKRAQAAQQDAAASLAARPWAPTPLPDRRRARRWQLLSGGLTLGILLTAALLLVGRAAGKRHGRGAGGPAGPAPPAQAAAALLVGAASSSPAIVSEVSVPPPTKGPAFSRQRLAPPRTVPKPTAAPIPPTRMGSTPTLSGNAVQPPAKERRAQDPGEGRTYTGEATLPNGRKIELGGIVYSEAHPVALINARVVELGSVVEGFTVAEIQTDRVKLEGADGTIWIRLK